ncbi:MAG TPA: CPBP family intramembrane metalloprotease [Bacilli bacterium]|nr:CPBP family intramembrane metalloprotease [Bacilli bacterium]
MKIKIKEIIKFILIFLLYLLYSDIIIIILTKLGVNIKVLPNNLKIAIMFLINLSLMIMLFIFYSKSIKENLKDLKLNFKSYIKDNFKYYVIGLLIMIISNIIISFFIEGNSTNETLIREYINIMPIYMIFSSCIYAPFTEEMVFRKSLRNCFNNKVLYILLSGLIFGSMHLLSASNLVELVFLIPYSSLGCVFAYMYYKTNNIFVPMTFHMVHNTIIVINYLLMLIIGG